MELGALPALAADHPILSRLVVDFVASGIDETDVVIDVDVVSSCDVNAVELVKSCVRWHDYNNSRIKRCACGLGIFRKGVRQIDLFIALLQASTLK